MREVTYEEYLEYVKKNDKFEVENQEIKLEPIRITRLEPLLEELTDISTTVWSFPDRGSWATHKGNYRGNWPPQIPRALMTMYTKPGDIVLDQMVGSGTTCIEARIMGRNCIGVDVNYNAVILTLHRLYYLEKYAKNSAARSLEKYIGAKNETIENILNTWSKVYHGDARKLDKLEDNSIDLIATHPPYFNIIKYGSGEEGNLSRARSLEDYLEGMLQIAQESYRVLKPGKYCAILIGDTRIHKHYVPISHYVLQMFLEAGFILKEEVVKIQHKMKTTREVWSKVKNRDFLLIAHEKLFILRKPSEGEKTNKFKYSRKQEFIEISLR
ncbi:MAG: hypothetical protein PWP49_1823 [Thermococcaceae archaeon]|jgi:DNA modification methylase|nr:hypothetical protein [Thermococcaceae archaeon]MDN5321403.1 hypothetical protein [Thermococcaceae archaeon]